MRGVCNCDHDRRCRETLLFPESCRFKPILAEQGIGILHQIGQRFFLFSLLAEIIFNMRIYMKEARFPFSGESAIITDNHTRRFDQARFNRVVQAKIADNPIEQGFFRTFFADGNKRCCREIISGKQAAGAVDAVKSANPDGGFVLFFLRDATQFQSFRDAPCVMGFIVDDENVLRVRHFAENLTDISIIAFRTAFIHTAFLRKVFGGFPIEHVPVLYNDFGLIEFFA